MPCSLACRSSSATYLSLLIDWIIDYFNCRQYFSPLQAIIKRYSFSIETGKARGLLQTQNEMNSLKLLMRHFRLASVYLDIINNAWMSRAPDWTCARFRSSPHVRSVLGHHGYIKYSFPSDHPSFRFHISVARRSASLFTVIQLCLFSSCSSFTRAFFAASVISSHK